MAGTVPAELYHLSALAWFNIAYAAPGVMIVLVCVKRRSIPLLNSGPLGQAQFFYLLFLWWIVIGNFERALVGFAPQRLVTEGVIHLNSVLCTVLIVLAPALPQATANLLLSFGRLFGGGIALFVLAAVIPWATIRGIYGDKQIGYASRHIRFGPSATATTEKPSPNKPHS